MGTNRRPGGEPWEGGEWRLREVRYPGVPNYAVLNSSNNLGITFTVGVKGDF